MQPSSKATEAVSTEVRAHLARNRKTQRDLSEVLGISQPQISARMNGDIAWDVNELAAIADWFGVPVTALIGEAA